MRGRAVSFTLMCDAQTGASCAGREVLKVTEKLHGTKIVGIAARKKRPRKKVVTVGHKTFSIPAHQHRAIVLRLNRRGQNLLKRFRTLRSRLTVVLNGSSAPSAAKTGTFKAPRRHRH